MDHLSNRCVYGNNPERWKKPDSVLKRRKWTIVECRPKDYASDNSLPGSTNPIASDDETSNFYQDFSLDFNHENNSLICRPSPFLLLSKRDRGLKLFWGYTTALRKEFDFKHLFLNNSVTPEDIYFIDFKKILQEVFGSGFIP